MLSKTETAKNKSAEAIAMETIQVEVAGSYGVDGKIDLNELNKNLSKVEGLIYNNVTIDINDDNKIIKELPVVVKLNGYNFQITNNGEVLLPQVLGSITKDNYGDYIDLGQSIVGTSATTDDWRILYNDKNGHVYAILADYLPNNNVSISNAGFGTDISKTYNVYSSTNRETLLARLENSTAWNSLIPNSLVIKNVTVKGASTGDIILASYNEKYNIIPAKELSTSTSFYIDNDSSKRI